MTRERSLIDDVVPLVTRFCRARLASAEAVASDLIAAVLEQHRDDTPVRVTTLRVASHAVAAVIRDDLPEPGSMHALLRAMPQLRADVLAMRVVVGATVDEVSAALGITPAAVLLAQHRALSALRATLAP
jgi:DNA-directed RNA polymerase specialized sigma24 family protein